MERKLFLFNTLGRKKELFKPLREKVTLYTCGPTVYDFAHIGNFRTFIFEDLLKRTLRHFGFDVVHVMNITDIDDKTIKRAKEEGVSLKAYTEKYTSYFFEDIETLGIEKADYYPKATEHVEDMIRIIGKLLETGIAYKSEGGVFFRIAKFPSYGQLSGVKLDSVKAGERVDHDEYGKEDVRDFALWKESKVGEPSWDAPWGSGRPGWHIECSAMSMRYLGETIDIHCGGVDNIFPHHENEIAQSEAYTGKKFVRFWLHSEHLIVDGQKMSKSLGNFFTLRDLLARGKKPRVLRYLLLSCHYRQKLNYTEQSYNAAEAALQRIDDFQIRVQDALEKNTISKVDNIVDKTKEDFDKALADDLNIARSLAALFTFIKDVNTIIDKEGLGKNDKEKIFSTISYFDRVLGVLDRFRWQKELAIDREMVEKLIEERNLARAKKDYSKADTIRNRLREMGVILEDTPSGTRWKFVE